MRQWNPAAASYVEVGKRLSHLRYALDLTQRDLAKQLSI
jgi:DNA-binding XRE family transcriptional regulator